MRKKHRRENRVKEPGEVFTVSRERATILERAKVAKIKE